MHFHYFLFKLVSTSACELRESACYVKVHVYCVFDYFLFNLSSNSVCELRESACLLCVWLFSLQSCLHFSRWVTWKCMLIVCLTIFSSILSLQLVSYVKVHVYCVFDYFLFNLVCTLAGEICESVCLLCVWIFSLQSCLHFRMWVMWKCMFIVCLTILSSILPPIQFVSYVKVHVYCVFDFFLFNLVSTLDCVLHESACLLCIWLFSLLQIVMSCLLLFNATAYTLSCTDQIIISVL